MITQEEFIEMKVLKKQGKSIRQISRESGRSRNTVRKSLRTEEMPKYPGRPQVASKLDPYKEYLKKRIEGAEPYFLSAPVLLKEIQEQGYHGKITILRNFLQTIRKKEEKPIQRYETEPGEQMQVDWVVLRRGSNPLSAFIGVLGHSRKSYTEFTQSEDELTLLRCHQNAFEYFGGVPKKVLYDNMKTVVIERDKYGKGNHGFQKTFLDFSKHYGFSPKLCHPYRPQTKGKVERFGGYLKHNFYYPLITKEGEDLPLGKLNYEAKKWLKEVADPRRLRERKSTPNKLFEKEKDFLQALPPPYLGMIMKLEVESIEQHSLELYEKAGGYQ
jgi:transposase